MKKERKDQRKKVILFGIIIVLFFSIIFSFLYYATPNITLKGKRILFVNINGTYQESGAQATYHGKDISKNIKIKGKVNSKKKGTYKIIYQIKTGIFQRSIQRTVIVKDIEKPKIELTGGETVSLCPGKKYEELGYKATDNVDGDLSKKVKIRESEDKITYQVTDKEGNKKVLVRTLVYEDKELPHISLLGGDEITIYQNGTYQELGYEVSDNCDDNLHDKVEVTGNVDTSKLGNYELVYTVVDSAGNKSEAKRTVHVIVPSSKGTIYLTFDDGPKYGTTDAILNILKEEGVKATFFVTNGGPDELIRREYNEGHTVALHTASHNYQTVYSSVEGYFNDLNIVHDRVLRITGQDSRIIRFPGGSSNTVSRKYSPGIMSTLTREVILRGYRYYDWNISSGDAGETTDPNVVYQNVVNALSRNRVNMVLMHDIKSYTKDALRNIIRYGKNNGYVFKKIENQTEMVTQRVNN